MQWCYKKLAVITGPGRIRGGLELRVPGIDAEKAEKRWGKVLLSPREFVPRPKI